MQPLWYRNAVIYQIDVAMFCDSDGDGWGDLAGVTERLEHVRELGATCIWLLPFYATAYRDAGYDVTDHLAVDPRFGDIADAALLLDKAEELGLRVIVDLVAQHTSTEHRWFQEARRDPDSPYRDYYVWADEPHETGVEQVFPTIEDGVWAWDEEAQQYYRHTFYSHEADLELGNPRVRQEMYRVMSYWLRLGVAGFRVDAVPYMVERARAADPRDDGMWLLEDMRNFVSLRRPDAILLGEADVPVEKYPSYSGDGNANRLTMLLDFWMNNHTFLALVRGDAEPMRRALEQQPDPPTHREQYANYLRNHDELDLERLTGEERQEVIDGFAPSEDMLAYGRGIRRRLAPMLGGDRRRIAMAHALLLSLPGAPVLLYGDEIGMGEDLARSERLAVRTPMQWTDAENAGFSTADADRLVAQPVSGDGFGYLDVNVYAQTQSIDSLLAEVGRIVRARTANPQIGSGHYRILDVGSSPVFALEHRTDGLTLITAVNVSGDDVRFTLPEDGTGYVDVLADGPYPEPTGESDKLELGGYGYRWLRRREDLFR